MAPGAATATCSTRSASSDCAGEQVDLAVGGAVGASGMSDKPSVGSGMRPPAVGEAEHVSWRVAERVGVEVVDGRVVARRAEAADEDRDAPPGGGGGGSEPGWVQGRRHCAHASVRAPTISSPASSGAVGAARRRT